MSRLKTVHRTENAVGDVIFVHGLGGDATTTWNLNEFGSWQYWISENRPDLNIWSIEYEVSPSEWTGGAMPLSDRAVNILALLDNRSIGARPLVFICHSMGGLLVKELLRHGSTVTVRFLPIVKNTKAIVFFATPHSGAGLADISRYLGFLLRNTIALSDLRAHHPHLRDLNLWFRNNFELLQLKTCIFFETQNTHGLRVVDETSSDPGIRDVSPIPIDANHITITKPHEYESIVVGQTLKILDEAIPSQFFKFDPDRRLISTMEQQQGSLAPPVPSKRIARWKFVVWSLAAASLVLAATLSSDKITSFLGRDHKVTYNGVVDPADRANIPEGYCPRLIRVVASAQSLFIDIARGNVTPKDSVDSLVQLEGWLACDINQLNDEPGSRYFSCTSKKFSFPALAVEKIALDVSSCFGNSWIVQRSQSFRGSAIKLISPIAPTIDVRPTGYADGTIRIYVNARN
jgi:pimeloyl-ACP methyl ester carboxylesterase